MCIHFEIIFFFTFGTTINKMYWLNGSQIGIVHFDWKNSLVNDNLNQSYKELGTLHSFSVYLATSVDTYKYTFPMWCAQTDTFDSRESSVIRVRNPL